MADTKNDLDEVAAERMQVSAKRLADLALLNAPDFDEAELVLSMASCLVRGMKGARRQKAQEYFDWHQNQAVLGRTEFGNIVIRAVRSPEAGPVAEAIVGGLQNPPPPRNP